MHHSVQGILLGLSLSVLVGPLLFALLQASLEGGFRAGVAFAAGTWVCDLAYIGALQVAVEEMTALTALPQFELWSGLTGALLLTLFGGGALMKGLKRRHKLSGGEEKIPVRKPYSVYWLHGFFINLFNPFTVLFWLGLGAAVIVPAGWSQRELFGFFAGMLGVLILSDTLKAFAARELRRWLTPLHLRQVQFVMGLILLVFGMALAIRVLYPSFFR